eukprot:4374118-Alexandrium_andersonii.AAC.1
MMAMQSAIPLSHFHTFFWRGCDNDALCQDVNLTCRPEHQAQHFFSSLETRMSETAQLTLHEMKPDPRSDEPKEIGRKNIVMEEFMKHHRKTLFQVKRTSSSCLKHPGKKCPVNFTPSQAAKLVNSTGCLYDEDAVADAITACVGGNPCTPWSPMGKQSRTAHPAYLTWAMWSEELVEAQFDFIGMENSSQFDQWRFKEKFNPTHEVITMVFGCEDSERANK